MNQMELPIRIVEKPIRAYVPPEPTLEVVGEEDICSLTAVGKCSDDACTKIHGIYRILGTLESASILPACNSLERKSRENPRSDPIFAPRDAILYGPKHDNDHHCITKIKILPTTDEIICCSPPSMPEKDTVSTPIQYLDLYFRHMRYDCIEMINDACYDGLQRIMWPKQRLEHRFETPKGVRYSLFSEVKFDAIKFHQYDGAMFSLSFDCPHSLRGQSLIRSNVFEKQKMCSLLVVHEESNSSTQDINIIHFEVKDRSPTNSDNTLTGSRTRASISVSLADRSDTSKVRQATIYAKGLINARFYLLHLPNVLPASFMPVLQQLQTFAKHGTFPFAEHTVRQDDVPLPPPNYATANDFQWNVSCLKKGEEYVPMDKLFFSSMLNGVPDQEIIDNIKNYTTLDDGQAVALYENLSRCLAFTQGPPGTGKTFLGVAEAEVILKSHVQGHGVPRKPIIVICATNHALDDFVLSLVARGMNKVVRLGTRSTNADMAPYLLPKVKSRKKLRPQDYQSRRKMLQENDKFANFAVEWAEELTSEPALRLLQDYLQRSEPEILREFERLDLGSDVKTELELLKASSAGFAFSYWLKGGDLEGLSSLLDDGININTEPPSYLNDVSDDDGDYQVRRTDSSKTAEIAEKTAEARKKTWLDTIRERKPKAENIVKSTKTALQEQLNEFQQRSSENTRTHQIWTMNHEQRQGLFETWKQGLNTYALCDTFTEIHRRYHVLCTKKLDWISNMDAFIIQELGVEVVALTATGAARNWKFLHSLRPETYIIEEASELTEPMTTAGLVPSIAHLIKIGDPLQLRPHVASQVFCTENDPRYRLDESLFERMMTKIPYSKLNLQRRAHTDMANLLRAGDYPYLLDNPSTASHPEIAGLKHRMFWVDHELMEDHPDPSSPLAKSFSNKYEVHFISEAVRYLVQRKGYNGKRITILTPYNGQVAAFAKALMTFCKVLLNDEDKESLISQGLLSESALNASKTTVTLNALIRVTSVDNYQGEENDIIFLSTVRSNHTRKTGFLANQNRINVAISRARNGFYVVGNSKLLRTNVDGWRKVIDVFEGHGRLGPYLPMVPCLTHQLTTKMKIGITNPEDFKRLPNCSALCGDQLPCGHFCAADCHPQEMHTDGRMKCTSPCTKILDCGHNCQKLCFEVCGKCSVPMEETTLNCGHTATITCSASIAFLQCSKVVKEVPGHCGHMLTVICGKTDPEPCKAPCRRAQSCDHICQNLCGHCKHEECNQRCGRILPCGHFCVAPCHYWASEECPPCGEPCKKGCSHGPCHRLCSEPCLPCIKEAPSTHCHHREPAILCGLPGSRLPCSEPCGLMARCGLHQCQGLCGEQCPDICDACEGIPIRKNVIALSCGHIFDATKLDARFEIAKLFQMEGLNIVKVNIVGYPNQNFLSCPTCSEPLEDCPRYALCEQILKHKDIIGGLLARAGRHIWSFMKSINDLQSLLVDVKKTCAIVKSGPLGMCENHNQESVAKPLTHIKTIQKEVEQHKLGVVKPVVDAILAYTTMLGTPKDTDMVANVFGQPRLSLLLRCDRVTLRCDMIIAKYLLDVLSTLRAREDEDIHLQVFMRKVKEEILNRMTGKIAKIDQAIKECQDAGLKRLEVEFIIQKSVVIGFLRRLGEATEEIGTELSKAILFCRDDRAAIFLGNLTYEALQNIMRGDISLKLDDAMNQKYIVKDGSGPQQLWRELSKFESGSLVKCGSSHYYCKNIFAFCPECGSD